jgi:diacylglycerol kinase (ATP)
MRALLVHNPAAGAGRSAGLLEPVLERLRAGGMQVDPHPTESLEDAFETARAAASSLDVVVAMGGDGTVGACAAGLAAAGLAAQPRTDLAATGAPPSAGGATASAAGYRAVPLAALGVIPAGGGNDGARNLGLPHADPLAAAVMLPGLSARPADLVRVGERYLLNAGGAGFDAEVSRRANLWFKKAPGRARYVGAVLAELAVGRPHSFRLDLDGKPMATSAWMVSVANSQSYGGGMRIAPNALLDDGLLDVMVVDGTLSKPGFLATFPKVFSGRHIEHPAVRLHRAARVRLEADGPVAVHLDGEPGGTVPATFEVVPAALAVLASAHAPAFSRRLPSSSAP